MSATTEVYLALLALLVLDMLQVLQVECMKLSIFPDPVHVDKRQHLVTFTCTADVPLTGCQVAFWASVTSPKLELSQGPQSRSNSSIDSSGMSYLDWGLTDYSYNGRGLGRGDCGITLEKMESVKYWVVGCRVHTERSGWKYAWTSLYTVEDRQIPAVVTPRDAVVLPGQDVNIMCQLGGPVGGCAFTLKTEPRALRFNQGPLSAHSTGRHRYHGAGLSSGECGLYLRGVSEEDNEPATCTANLKYEEGIAIRHIPIIIARPPSRPELTVVYNGSYSVLATCTVPNARPVADITWLLDNEILRRDEEDDGLADHEADWRWPWDIASITQRFAGILVPQDHGKRLRCVVAHPALTETLEASQEIIIRNDQGNLTSNTTVTCRKPETTSSAASCVLDGVPVLCNKRPKAGTIALLFCKEGYTTTTGKASRSVTCQPDGRWSGPLLTCSAACGVRNTAVTGLIAGGSETRPQEFPWHVAVYRRVRDSFTYICGGSLITPRHVITAAHCYWNPRTNTAETNRTLYRIVAGKHRREWNETDPAEQRMSVAQVYPHELFNGVHTHNRYDIAVIRLENSVKLSRDVHLVCIDWETERDHLNLLSGRNGTVAGWGLTESGQLSDVLRTVDLEIVPTLTCHNNLPLTSRKFLTYDKFCAGFKDQNTSVCAGDSGGGLVFLRDSGRYDLLGIVSTDFRDGTHITNTCFSRLYTSFTRVSEYLEWLQNIIHN